MAATIDPCGTLHVATITGTNTRLTAATEAFFADLTDVGTALKPELFYAGELSEDATE